MHKEDCVYRVSRTVCIVATVVAAFCCNVHHQARGGEQGAIRVAVMDPLAADLACACVEGFAQRKYEVLAIHLEGALDRAVDLRYGADLGLLADEAPIDLVIGKKSIVEYDLGRVGLKAKPVAMLTSKEGKTTFRGLFVVASGNRAAKVEDLQGYELFIGKPTAEEKHGAALAALEAAGVDATGKTKEFGTCTDSAMAVINAGTAKDTAAVVSDYAKTLLVGCGTIDADALRVIGQTKPVPFIAAFVTDNVSDKERRAITEALLSFGENKAFLPYLETKSGFVPLRIKDSPSGEQQNTGDSATASENRRSVVEAKDWPQFRGADRDGLAPALPKTLSDEAIDVAWSVQLQSNGLSGLAATEEVVIVPGRDVTDMQDHFLCLDAETGNQKWALTYFAPGDLDYGNSPRATPLIVDDRVYLLGAFGMLHCVDLESGEVLWQRNLPFEFQAEVETWGYCSSPLIVDGKLIVNPGGALGGIAALDPKTGETIWTGEAMAAGYGSFVAGKLGGVAQVVGYDKGSLGGWDVKTGLRLWQLVPPEPGDFNVPTPIITDGKLLVTTENNGTRLYAFNDGGAIIPEPLMQNEDLAPDTMTPVLVNGLVIGCWYDLLCLDLNDGLKTLWAGEDDAYLDYVSIIADEDRVLVSTVDGQLILVENTPEAYREVGRVRLFPEDSDSYSHPALVGDRLYIRNETTLVAIEL